MPYFSLIDYDWYIVSSFFSFLCYLVRSILKKTFLFVLGRQLNIDSSPTIFTTPFNFRLAYFTSTFSHHISSFPTHYPCLSKSSLFLTLTPWKRWLNGTSFNVPNYSPFTKTRNVSAWRSNNKHIEYFRNNNRG